MNDLPCDDTALVNRGDPKPWASPAGFLIFPDVRIHYVDDL